jgi:hypothetical protein
LLRLNLPGGLPSCCTQNMWYVLSHASSVVHNDDTPNISFKVERHEGPSSLFINKALESHPLLIDAHHHWGRNSSHYRHYCGLDCQGDTKIMHLLTPSRLPFPSRRPALYLCTILLIPFSFETVLHYLCSNSPYSRGCITWATLLDFFYSLFLLSDVCLCFCIKWNSVAFLTMQVFVQAHNKLTNVSLVIAFIRLD